MVGGGTSAVTSEIALFFGVSGPDEALEVATVIVSSMPEAGGVGGGNVIVVGAIEPNSLRGR